MYFVINNSEGDTFVKPYTEEELVAALNDDEFDSYEFLDAIPEADTNYWGETVLIIKGEVTVPQVVKTVTEYKL